MQASDLLDAENPWPGLRPFTETAQAFFHGRDAEIIDLFRLVRRRPLTVLFGRSGLGKSSLLQAGLFPRLRREHYLPVYIRLELGAEAPPLIEQVTAKLAQEMRARGVAGPHPVAGQTLWGYFHRIDTAFHDA